MEFIVTFGQQYRNVPHPKVRYAHPDGFLVVVAESESQARDKAFEELGPAWSHMYPNDGTNNHYYPLGELHRI